MLYNLFYVHKILKNFDSLKNFFKIIVKIIIYMFGPDYNTKDVGEINLISRHSLRI